MNMFTFTTTFVSVFFLAFLAGVYFLKDNMSNIDNKIYKYILISDFILIVSSLICLLTARYLDYHKSMMLIYDITARIFCVVEMIWYLLLMLYTLIITSGADTRFRDLVLGVTKKGQKIRFIVVVLYLLAVLIAPVNYSFDAKGILVYNSGLRITLMLVMLALTVPFLVIFLIKKRGKYEIKKIIPFIIIIGFQLSTFFISQIDGSINLYPLTITLISYLMYHTIENPDLKLINRLKQAKEQAEKSNKEKTEFLSSMSHELRTPLNGIIGLTALVVEEDNKEQIKEDSKDILKAANNLLELVDGMLDINNLETDKLKLTEDNYNPELLFKELIKITEIKLFDKDIELRTNFSEKLPLNLYGDREKVKRVINNLLTNAAKYTEKGYIDFNVDCINENDICKLKITVRDTGRGIEEEQKQFLFQKFYRRKEDMDSNIFGTGLGLAVTKSLLDIMKGTISVDSIYKQGTTFTVELEQKIQQEELELI